jgi:hypothetical protein
VRAKRLEGRSSSLTRSFADGEETAFCIVGNLLSIGLAPSADQCATTLFRNSILVNAILNAMLSSESANSFGEKADVSQDCFSFLGFSWYF